MENFIFSIIIGIVFLVIGILNLLGNVNLLHSYHRDNVKEEDKKPFGKLVGIGMIIVGLSLIGLSYGAKVEKMSVGHHGSNIAIKNINTKRVQISNQNHAS